MLQLSRPINILGFSQNIGRHFGKMSADISDFSWNVGRHFLKRHFKCGWGCRGGEGLKTKCRPTFRKCRPTFKTLPLTMKNFNTPKRVQTSLVSPLRGVTSSQNCSYRRSILVKLKLHLWHSKFHLSIIINKMTSPQNCSYRKPNLSS